MSSTILCSSQDLTVDNVVRVLQCVPTAASTEHSTTWRYLPRHWKRSEWVATGVLHISYQKYQKITKVCSNEEEQLRAVVRFWLVLCPYASWRWLIWQLDGWYQFELADEIRVFAEPLQDHTLTFENVCEVINKATKRFHMFTIEYCLTIPMNKRRDLVPLSWWGPSRIQEYEDYRNTLVKYWVSCSPFASWENLAGQLFRCREEWGLDLLTERSYLKLTDSSVTVKNFWRYQKELTRILSRASIFSEWLNITKDDFPLLLLYTNTPSVSYTAEKILLKIVKCYVNNHPAPSWEQATYALYMTGLYRVVVDVQRHYIDGDLDSISLQSLCVNEIASSLKNPEHANLLPLPPRLQSNIISCNIIKSI